MKASDSSSSKPNFDSDQWNSKKCEEYYATMNKRGILSQARPTLRHLRAQNPKPESDEQKWDCILHDMEVLCRMMQICMEDNQRIEDVMRDLWEDLNLNVMPPRKRTAEEVAQFVDWRPFGRHLVALEEGSQEDDSEEEDEDESEEDSGEYEGYEMKKAVILHNKGALSRMHQVYTENRQRMKDIARQMYEGLRRNDPPITDLKDEEIAWMVNWAETFWKTCFNT
ncbi:hypothetical protein L195_g009477 [Trifolium pratense]|uniref:Uncharacterized protein n=1 Tax=Trifolium pratense TaxID=57577 RepID=A0A2K3LXC8_TRIPR|nr:hypothetical protein L195_g039218 [Trifolium pratense]PNX85577.1 hypothetical protein L195_g041647 [Trifolium pratense]PNY12836.1 hypothetical protein L195_g009477 [Trifolium pratense]